MRGSAAPLALLFLVGTLRLALAQQAADEAPSAAVNPNPLSSLSLDSLSATRSLPLFTPSRTAPVVDAPVADDVVVAAPAEPELPQVEEPPPALELVGIVLTGSTQTALLRNPSTDEVLRLKSGDEFEEWALKIVDARSIELRRGDRVQGFKMFEIFPAAAPPMPGGEPFDQGMPPEMNVEQPFEEIPQEDPEGMYVDPEGPPPDALPGRRGSPSPPPEGEPSGEPGADFAPQPGDAPIPEEGALSPEGNATVNQ